MIRFHFIAFLFAISVLTAAAGPLVNFNDTWRYRKGTSAPQGDWKTAEASGLDGSWLSGPGWIGYGDGSGANTAGTTLADMEGNYRSIYARITFTVPADTCRCLYLVQHHQLRVRFHRGGGTDPLLEHARGRSRVD